MKLHAIEIHYPCCPCKATKNIKGRKPNEMIIKYIDNTCDRWKIPSKFRTSDLSDPVISLQIEKELSQYLGIAGFYRVACCGLSVNPNGALIIVSQSSDRMIKVTENYRPLAADFKENDDQALKLIMVDLKNVKSTRDMKFVMEDFVYPIGFNLHCALNRRRELAEKGRYLCAILQLVNGQEVLDLPGGRRQLGESSWETIKRQIREQTCGYIDIQSKDFQLLPHMGFDIDRMLRFQVCLLKPETGSVPSGETEPFQAPIEITKSLMEPRGEQEGEEGIHTKGRKKEFAKGEQQHGERGKQEGEERIHSKGETTI